MKNILVTGAGGWLGIELLEQLLLEEHKVKALVLSSTSILDELYQKYPNKMEIIVGDIADRNLMEECMQGVEIVYHLAAKVHSKPKNNLDIEEFYYVNRDCTNQLFDLALKCGVNRVVFFSTVAVYGNKISELVRTITKHNPTTPYGHSKHQAEEYGLELWQNYKFPITIIQPVTVYGGADRGNFRKLYNLSQRGISVRFGSGKNKKTIIYYKDLIKMVLNIVKDEDTLGKTFICGTEVIDYNSILKKINSYNNKVIKIVIPEKLSKLIIYSTKFKIRKLINLSETINTLMCDNIYDIETVKKYIDSTNVIYFENWLGDEEYGKKNRSNSSSS